MMDGELHRWMDGCNVAWMNDGWVDDGWTVAWMDGWMDG